MVTLVSPMAEAEFRTKFEEEWVKTLQILQRPYEVGQRVEALSSSTTNDVHALFYSGYIRGISEEESFTIEYEDGAIDKGINPLFVRPYGRETVFEDELLKIVDGHISVRGIAQPARLLSFQCSPQLYQSAVLLREGVPVHSSLAFEQHQALAISLAFKKEQLESGTETPVRIALVGAGGFTIPMTIEHHFPLKTKMDVCEISGSVIQAAQTYFGVVEEENHLRIYEKDGAAFLHSAPSGGYDIILIDAAEADTPDSGDDPDALEVPPPVFVEPEFLQDTILRALEKEDSVVCYNIIAGRRKLIQLATLFESMFSSVYILATDPNYFFFGFTSCLELDPTELVELVREIPNLDKMTPDVVKLVLQTEENKEEEILLGWFTVTQFVSMCENESVIA